MSTTIIYNPMFGDQESRTSRIRRSRKRPLGEAASSPSSILVGKIESWRNECVVAATCIFLSATGLKPCTIPAQQHRPRGSPNQREAISPAELQQVRRFLSPFSLALPFPPSSAFFFFSLLGPPQGDLANTVLRLCVPERSVSGTKSTRRAERFFPALLRSVSRRG